MTKVLKLFDLDSQFTKNYQMFFWFGYWKPDKNYKHKTLYNLYTVFCFGVLIAFILPQLVYMIVFGSDIYKLTSTLYVFITFFINLVKTLGIYFNMDVIKDILRNFKENPLLQAKFEKHVKIAEKTKTRGDFLFLYGTFLGFGTQLFWSIYPFSQNKKMLPVNGWYPYNPMSSPNYELTTFFQNFASAFNIFHTMNIDSFTINLMMQTGLQCDFLQLTLKNIMQFHTVDGILCRNLQQNREPVEDILTPNLKTCIRHYIEIKRIARKLEDIYRTSMAIVFLGGAFIFCAIFYQMLHGQRNPTEIFYLLFFLFSMLTEQFIFCWFGNEITFKSGQIHGALCSIPWVDCSVKFRKMLVIFLISLTKPISLNAGRIIPLSARMFLQVLRTSYSYLALLNSL